MKAQLRNTAKILALGLIALININAKTETSLFYQEKETDLEIENWMTDDSLWSNNIAETTVAIFNVEEESDLDIEEWMTDESLWSNGVTETTAAIFNVEEESDLDIENWMTNDYYWSKLDACSELYMVKK